MAINKTTQYTTDPNTIPVDTSTGSQDLSVALDSRVSVSGDELFLIPTDYPTLQAAFDDLGGRVSPNQISTIEIRIESGHIPTEGLILSGGNYSKYRITSADPTVGPIATGFTGKGTSNSFLFFEDCWAPVIDILVDGNGNLDNGFEYWSSNGKIESGKGCNGASALGNSSRGLYVLTGVVTARNTRFNNCGRGAWITRGANADLEGAECNDALEHGIYVSRASNASFYGSQARRAGSTGVVSNRSQVTAREASVSLSNRGMQAENGGLIEARLAVADDCTEYGFFAVLGGKIYGTDTNAISAGTFGYRVASGGYILADSRDGTISQTANWWYSDGIIIDSGQPDFDPPA